MATIEPALDASDIQGNILPGFRRQQQLVVAFGGTEEQSVRAALVVIGEHLTPLPDVLDHKDSRKLAFLNGAPPPVMNALWANYALGPAAARALGLVQLDGLEPAFAAGMLRRTGDPTNPTLPDGTPNPAAPDHWLAGGPSNPIDLLLIFAADDDVQGSATPIVEAIVSCGLTLLYAEQGELLPEDKEHFGFQDGISQTGVYGTVEIAGSKRYLTTRYGVPSSGGVDYGKPGQPLVDPSQFLFDATDPELENGSFLVFRRLEQNVARFYADTVAMAGTLAALAPSIDADGLRARIVGRWPSGQPLMRPSVVPHDAEIPLALNHFAFAHDESDLILATGEKILGAAGDPEVQAGGRCPIWAHIRKVNPRDLQTDKGGPDDTRGFQMLRRSIPFGPLFDHGNPDASANSAPRGLLFLSYQRSISEQFETLNTDWMNNSDAPASFGYDLLIGQHVDPLTGLHAAKAADLFDSTTGQTQRFASLSEWVRPTAGGYLFAPSISWTKRKAAQDH